MFHDVYISRRHGLEDTLSHIVEPQRDGIGGGILLPGHRDQLWKIDQNPVEARIFFQERDDKMSEPAAEIGDLLRVTKITLLQHAAHRVLTVGFHRFAESGQLVRVGVQPIPPAHAEDAVALRLASTNRLPEFAKHPQPRAPYLLCDYLY